jgi:anti-sigma regulatory factor (Ser/Thr protein kinase)
MPRAEVTLPADVSSVPTARHFVESILSGWGQKDMAWVATMVVSELAANAALHARGEDFRVRVSTVAEGIRIEVDDNSIRLPQQRTYSREATTGRGLTLVSELAQEWGFDSRGAGKTVWAVLRADAVHDDDDDVDVDALLDAFDDGEAVGEVTPLFDRRHPQVRTTLFAA